MPQKSPPKGSRYPIWEIPVNPPLEDAAEGSADEQERDPERDALVAKNAEVMRRWGMSSRASRKVAKGIEVDFQLKDDEVQKQLEWLTNEYQMKKEDIAKVVETYPVFLCKSISDEVAPFMEVFIKRGYGKDRVKKIITSTPWILGLSSKLEPTLKFFKESLGFKEDVLMKVFVKNANILRFTINENLKPKVDFLLGLGLGQPEVRGVIKDCPKLLRSSLENCMIPNVEKLKTQGLRLSQIALAVKRAPQVITRDFERIVEPKFKWLEEEIGMSGEERISYFVSKPGDFLAALETWKNTFEWFVDKNGGSKDEAIPYLLRQPTILSYKADGLEEKIDFANKRLDKKVAKIFETPAYLWASLEGTIMFRTAFMQSKNHDATAVSLSHLVSTRSKFCESFSLEEYDDALVKWQKLDKNQKLESIQSMVYPWTNCTPNNVPCL